MSKNIKITILFSVLFLAALGANIISGSDKANNRIVTIYSDIIDNKELTKKIDTLIKSNNIETSISEDSNFSSDVKLKYSVMISDDERKNYDVFNIRDENLYAVTLKDTVNNITYQDILSDITDGNKQINSTLIVFSTSSYKWFIKHINPAKSAAYSYGYIPKILNQDKTMVGIVFDSEITNKNAYNFRLINSDNTSGEKLKDTLCLLIKKGRLDSKIGKEIVDELRK